ncbi:thermonuclease family protein [Sulfurimonas sp. NWX79]|uniref:thermonuclease family protein n=1 Tax=Campylobacterales TaxID=213849 RepID=UPI0032049150|nr:thermonuclease family protein [Sulfurimonas phage SNW-1]
MKFLYATLILLLNLHAQSLKDSKFEDVIVSKVTSIYDGDTFRVNIKDYPKIIGYRIPVRVNGIDTPELRAQCIKEKNLARTAKKITVRLLRNAKTIELKNIKRGKYFRIVADVYVDGKLLSEILLQNKVAVRYDGGKKIDWCK